MTPCPSRDSGLVIINGELTIVEGGFADHHTNKLFTLRQRQWIEVYPPMKSARSDTAIVNTSDGEYIIVIGWVG